MSYAEFYTLEEVLRLLKKHDLKENYLDSLIRREKATPYYFYEGFLKSYEGCIDTSVTTITMHFSGYVCPTKIPRLNLGVLRDAKKARNYVSKGCAIGKTESIELESLSIDGQYISAQEEGIEKYDRKYFESFLDKIEIHGCYEMDLSLGCYFREKVYFKKSTIDELVLSESSLLESNNYNLRDFDINLESKNKEDNAIEAGNSKIINENQMHSYKETKRKLMNPMAYKGVSKIFNGLFINADKNKISIDKNKYFISDEMSEVAIATLLADLILEALPLVTKNRGIATHGLINKIQKEGDVSQETASKWIRLAQHAKAAQKLEV